MSSTSDLEKLDELNDMDELYVNIDELPDEIIMTIMSYLDGESICSLSLVNKTFNNIYKSQKLWSYMIRYKYQYVYSIIMSMTDNDYSLDMWFYFYKNMDENKQYIKYYINGVIYMNMLEKTLIKNNVDKFEYLLILLINDKKYIPNHNSLKRVLFHFYNVNMDEYKKWVKIIIASQKFRDKIDIPNLCDHYIDRNMHDLSVYMATNYLDKIDSRNFRYKYKNSLTINILMDPSQEYTMDEYYRELVDICDMPSCYKDHLLNVLSEEYVNMKTGVFPFSEDIILVNKFKYKIKNIINKHNNLVSKSEIIKYKYLGKYVIKYTVQNNTTRTDPTNSEFPISSKLLIYDEDQYINNFDDIGNAIYELYMKDRNIYEKRNIQIYKEDNIIYVSTFD